MINNSCLGYLVYNVMADYSGSEFLRSVSFSEKNNHL